ncbi:LOW QUALITY PROTEIN: homeobox protein CDX-4 [Saccopteryx leptura]|uniref:LOW QUALITY PROTEIN: homeobox protein CDX-4 n=1 Tax=Saccopteryx leptura TaxID=249018 RepID=UPI00339CEBE1
MGAQILETLNSTVYRSCLLGKKARMYLGILRSPVEGSTTGGGGSELPTSNFTAVLAYTHYIGYTHGPSIDLHPPSLATWGSPYRPPQEDWSTYYPGPSSAMNTGPMSDMTSTPGALGLQEHSNLSPTGSGSSDSSLPAPAGRSLFPIDAGTTAACSPSRNHYSHYAWMHRTIQVTGSKYVDNGHVKPQGSRLDLIVGWMGKQMHGKDKWVNEARG